MTTTTLKGFVFFGVSLLIFSLPISAYGVNQREIESEKSGQSFDDRANGQESSQNHQVQSSESGLACYLACSKEYQARMAPCTSISTKIIGLLPRDGRDRYGYGPAYYAALVAQCKASANLYWYACIGHCGILPHIE
jgi:hypothetical protein